MSKTQNPLLSRKMEEKWPKMINTEVLDMGGSCKPNENKSTKSVADPDLQMRRGGGVSRPFTPQFGLKKKGRAPPLDPPLQMRP